MIDDVTKADIDKISHQILKDCKAYKKFPTPIDTIVDYSELTVEKSIDLSNQIPSLGERVSDTLLSAFSKIRGILDRKQKTIYLDLSQSNNRKGFVKLHEVGHNVLPWQNAMMEYLDDDSTLDQYTKDGFEAEANYFASATLFQQDIFINEINKFPLELATPMHMAKIFGASNHASIRRYVECTKNRCALLVLEDITMPGVFCQCSVRNYFQSESFTKTFGEIEWNEKLGYKWAFVKDYYHGRRFLKDKMITLDTENGSIEFEYHFFNNTYNAFILLFPKGEKNKSRYDFVVSG